MIGKTPVRPSETKTRDFLVFSFKNIGNEVLIFPHKRNIIQRDAGNTISENIRFTMSTRESTVTTLLMLPITWLLMYFNRLSLTTGNIRISMSNGSNEKIINPALSNIILPNEFRLRKIHSRKGNVHGKNATKPLVRNPRVSMKPDKTINK